MLTLSLFLLIPALVVVIHLAINAGQVEEPPAPLVWAEHPTWPRNQFTVFKSLQRGQMSSARTNRVHHAKLGLQVTPAVYLATQRLAQLAGLPRDEFMAEHTRTAMADILDRAEPGSDLFYGHYLLATWYRLHQQPDAADDALADAFALAPPP